MRILGMHTHQPCAQLGKAQSCKAVLSYSKPGPEAEKHSHPSGENKTEGR